MVNRMTPPMWKAVDAIVASISREGRFDYGEIHKAVAYLRMHRDEPSRLMQWLQTQTTASTAFKRSRQTRAYHDALWKAVRLVQERFDGDEWGMVLGATARLLQAKNKLEI